ncbi:MAG: hypothetical protein J6A83_04930 [Clostridia bacterium]|nr:hypothetical protein [Clostridia bacterium]
MKKILAITLSLLFILTLMTAAIGATDGGDGVGDESGELSTTIDTNNQEPSYLPTNINGEATYAYKSVVSFDEDDIAGRLQPQTNQQNNRPRCAWEIVETGGANGKALKMVANGNTAEGNIDLGGVQDWSKWDGLMVYVDMSGVIPKDGKAGKGGIGIRLTSALYDKGIFAWTRNGNPNANVAEIPGFEINAWYLVDGSWVKADQAAMDGERIQVPEDFAGWVYIPFTSYITIQGSEGTPEGGVYQSEFINKIMLLSGPYTFADPADGEENTSVVIVDEINLVKLGVNNEEMEEILTATEATTTEATTEKRQKATMPTTAAKTNAKTTAAGAADETTAEAEEEKSGCGSTITVASVMMIAAAAAIPAVASKRRRK